MIHRMNAIWTAEKTHRNTRRLRLGAGIASLMGADATGHHAVTSGNHRKTAGEEGCVLPFLIASPVPSGGLSAADVIVPLVVFLLGAIGTGVVGLVKFTSYMARSQSAQESIAKSNLDIAKKLDDFIALTNGAVQDLERRMSVVEYARDHGQFRAQGTERRKPEESP
jgi:hypothetical protein